MRDVVEKRFGLKGGKKKTLEAIGKEYKITRERVRQIEADALKHLRREEQSPALAALFQTLGEYMHAHGDVLAARHLLSLLGEPRMHPHFSFFLEIGRQFSFVPETASFHSRWTVQKQKTGLVEKMVTDLTNDLAKGGVPVDEGALLLNAGARAKEGLGEDCDQATLSSYIATSKSIGRNPYGEYGLTSWSSIHPRGVRDKAHQVLTKSAKPMHFRDVASAINQVGWTKRKAHPQTVHNELIKDSRFVLVGRGLYALRDWGYEPGVVRDVVLSVLKKASRPLSRDEIVKLVSEKRLVKPQTILLNLQNRSLFRKTDGGMYALA